MILKKPTLVILTLAIILGGVVYYFDWKRGNQEKPETLKRAYSLQASDVVSMTLSHPAHPSDPAIHFAKQNGAWQIAEPVQTAADQSTVDGIVDQIACAEVAETEPGTPDRLKAYGLDPAQSSLELRLANGTTHTLLIGSKTFTGDNVYAIVDGSKNVSLLPELLATSTARNLDTLRDRTVLHFDTSQSSSFAIRNSSGEIEAAKQDDRWKIQKPTEAPASQTAVDSLLQAVSGGNMVSVASETPDDLAHYGLANPAISFTETNSKGSQSTLLIGKKDGDAYFARDTSRPMIFRVNADLYTKLSQKFADLRDKKVVQLDSANVQAVELRNATGSISISRKKDSEFDWVFSSPADQKGKLASSWKILDPVTDMNAEEVIDHPPANLAALVANPAVTVVLTDKAGKAVTVRISKPSGDFVYAQTTDSPALYKLKKDIVDTLNLKPADVVLSS